jgi:hypothetical protein
MPQTTRNSYVLHGRATGSEQLQPNRAMGRVYCRLAAAADVPNLRGIQPSKEGLN